MTRKAQTIEASKACARDALAVNDCAAAAALLYEALWLARTNPKLEYEILDDIRQLYKSKNVAFDLEDYYILVDQYEQLMTRFSSKVVHALDDVQRVKYLVISRMPKLRDSH
jgi:hypothetical protein